MLGYLSDPDDPEADFPQEEKRGGGVISSTMDLVQAINDLIESEEFIEFRGVLPNTGELEAYAF